MVQQTLSIVQRFYLTLTSKHITFNKKENT